MGSGECVELVSGEFPVSQPAQVRDTPVSRRPGARASTSPEQTGDMTALALR